MNHNLDFLKSSSHPPTHRFLEEMMDLGLLPSITRPTRITHSTATLIDNILIDQKFSENYKSSVLIDNISDHLPYCTTLCGITAPRNRNRTITSRDIHDKNIDKLVRELQQTDWEFLDSQADADSKFNSFHEHLTSIIDNFCPIREREISYKKIRREPWITSGLLISTKKCKKLYKLSISANKTAEIIKKVQEL